MQEYLWMKVSIGDFLHIDTNSTQRVVVQY